MPFGLSFSNVCMRPEFTTLMSCDSSGTAWSNHCWPMANTLAARVRANGGHFEHTSSHVNLLIINLFSLHLMNFLLLTTLDAPGNTPWVHYKSMKYNVSFSHVNVALSMLFWWGGCVFHVCLFTLEWTHDYTDSNNDRIRLHWKPSKREINTHYCSQTRVWTKYTYNGHELS